DDIALGLAASGVRIEAPIPGKAAVGIEVPNKKQTPVFLREVLDSKEFTSSNKKLAFALGKDIGGACVVGDLSKMPHTLIAGATGSGKSVCINSLIISLLYKYSPDEVKLLMVDPKVVELNVYNGIPHLLIPVVTDPKKAAAALNWAVNEMTKRYNLFAEMGVRNIDSYNALMDKGIIEEKLPYIVIIVDELADLMMVCPNDVEDYIGRLAQMARAAGMHLVIATQRPSVDVITGVIKANIPSRISFAVSSQVDSRTILDSAGAEKLLGKGDMLYYPVGESKPQRVQGCFISEEEVEKVIEFIKSEEKDAVYEESILNHINNETEGKNIDGSDDADELLPEAINLVIEYEQASTSFLQRRLRVGFNRASRIMDQLEERGIISPKDGSRPRQVLMKKEDLLHNSDNMEEN
ncbi:MAG: DNA translocase FtsK, partial [Clostridium paraputrificum]